MEIIKFYKLLILICLTTASNLSFAAILFSDGFESGNLSHSENGISFFKIENAAVSTNNAKSGSNSLEFFYRGGGNNSDAWSEVRMNLPQRQELWIRYDLYIPSNYNHRNVSPANNKFLAVYRDPYTNPGFQVNFSLEPNGSGGSDLTIKRYHNGSEAGGLGSSLGNNFITSADKGSWIRLIMRIKVPSGNGTRDAIMQMWKNGNLVADQQSFNAYGANGKNYIDELYLLGWSNSGYSQDTYFYIDNIEVSDSPLVDQVPSDIVPSAPSSFNMN